MKKILSVVLAVLVVISLASCTKSSGDDTLQSAGVEHTFRNTDWGDSKWAVIKSEKGLPRRFSGDYLLYKGKINEMNCSIIYRFDEEKLCSAEYYISKVYTGTRKAENYISAYDQIAQKLYDKYGDAVEDDIIELDGYEEVFDDSTNLLYDGIAYRAKWETDTTDIMLGMIGENFDITISLTYTQKGYESNSDTTDF